MYQRPNRSMVGIAIPAMVIKIPSVAKIVAKILCTEILSENGWPEYHDATESNAISNSE